MGKRILFRVDAGDDIGLGHFYRSVNLAKYLRHNGHYIEFVHRPSSFWDGLADFDFTHRVLPGEAGEQCLLDMVTQGNFELFYVDGMIGFSAPFIRKVKEKATVVFYQNLTSSRTLADIFILPSIHQRAEFFEGFSDTTTLYNGLEYFTFNEAVEQYAPKKNVESQPASRIAVIAGGSDPRNVLLKIRQLLAERLPHNLAVTFYYGQSYMHMSELPVNSPGLTFSPYHIGDILNNDILVAAFGVSTYEFMHLGMPIISIAHQESNHIASKAIAEKKNAILDLGIIDELTSTKLIDTIQLLVNDPRQRAVLAENARKAVDLNGISRVANIIENA